MGWRRLALVGVGMSGIAMGATVAGLATLARPRGEVAERRVQDVTQLVQIGVERVVAPRSAVEVQAVVATHDGPISIGGGRFSMGGQIATEDTLFLDLREMDDVLALDIAGKTIRVEAGITWRKIQEAIDGHDLSVKIMQSYANFSVGGSMSVNAHGRYVGLGPVVHAVRSFDIVLADGTTLHASRDEHPDVFFGAIGGYGALGVITEVELDLADNVAVQRTVERMPLDGFEDWFASNIEGSDAVFFNADLYPPTYDELVSISFVRTDLDVTVPDRLQPEGGSTAAGRFTYWWVSEAPLGKEMRSEVIDRMRLADNPVVWRNYEASYDVWGLEPSSRDESTYVLQEYFVPVDQLEVFAPRMAEIFNRYDVNVVNVSIRHAEADPDTLLSWAPTDVFAFVVYYKQGTAEHDQAEVGIWTREMSDALIDVGATWYLPYQPHATPDQFRAAYPGADRLFDLKGALDPSYTFRNKLWDRYLPPAGDPDRAAREAATAARLAEMEAWQRPEDQTFLTLPEWYIVYSADELGAHLAAGGAPSEFPFFASIGQFWEIYGYVRGRTQGRYAPNRAYHAMIWTIGASFTAEYAVKGLWEGTVGRLTEWWSDDGWRTSPLDQHYAEVAAEYGAFLHHTPWFAFPYGEHRRQMPDGDGSLRSWERRLAVGVEFFGKGLWGQLMGGASAAAYGAEDETILAWVKPHGADPSQVEGVAVVEELKGGHTLVSVPRYEPFTSAVPALVAQGVEFVQIAGCRRLLVQVDAPRDWDRARLWGDPVVDWPMAVESDRRAVALEVPVGRLHEVLPALQRDGVTLTHLYDY